MNLLDVYADGRYRINLDHVRRIQAGASVSGKRAEIKFVYSNGEEDIFGVSPGRLAVIDDLLQVVEDIAS